MVLKKFFVILTFLFIGLIVIQAGKIRADTCYQPFVDVPCDYWNLNHISALKNAGITHGCNPPVNTMFCPQDITTRAHMVTFIVRAIEGTPTNYNPNPYYTDVPSSHWAFIYIQRARELGIAYGYGDGSFGPDNPVTREQMATMLVRALAIKGRTSIPPDNYCSTGSPFSDVDPNGWSCQYIKKLKELGLIQPCNPPQNDRFCPFNAISRAQVAAYMYKLFLSY